MKIIKMLFALLVSTLLPMGAISWALAANGTAANETVITLNLASNTSNVNSTNATISNETLEEVAYNLLLILDRLANYTAGLLEQGNLTNSTLELYHKAEGLRTEAWHAYNIGNFTISIEKAIHAMGVYKEVIEKLTEKPYEEKDYEHEYYELMIEAKEEVERMSEYFIYAKKLIEEAQKAGIDVSDIILLYNQTKEMYLKVEQDLLSGNFTALEKDLENARELKDKLDSSLEELSEEIIKEEADEIVKAFMEKLEEQMELIQELIAIAQKVGVNQTYLNQSMEMLQLITANVSMLVQSGQYEKALELMEELNHKLEEIVESMEEAKEEISEEYGYVYCEHDDGYVHCEYERSDEEHYEYHEYESEEGEQYEYHEYEEEDEDSYMYCEQESDGNETYIYCEYETEDGQYYYYEHDEEESESEDDSQTASEDVEEDSEE